MDEIHINVGIVALARGFITLEDFAKGMHSLAQTKGVSIRDLWCAPGLLDEKQLATVLDASNRMPLDQALGLYWD